MMMGRWREGVRAAVEVQVGLEEDRQALCLHRSRASESFGGTGPGPQSVRSTSTAKGCSSTSRTLLFILVFFNRRFGLNYML